jgi:hypothetical protein
LVGSVLRCCATAARAAPELESRVLGRDLAAHRFRLLGQVDQAHAALADLLQQLVRADDRAGAFRQCTGAVCP